MWHYLEASQPCLSLWKHDSVRCFPFLSVLEAFGIYWACGVFLTYFNVRVKLLTRPCSCTLRPRLTRWRVLLGLSYMILTEEKSRPKSFCGYFFLGFYIFSSFYFYLFLSSMGCVLNLFGNREINSVPTCEIHDFQNISIAFKWHFLNSYVLTAQCW